jgi:hypothetical protein
VPQQSTTVDSEAALNQALQRIDLGQNFDGTMAAAGTAYTVTIGQGFTLTSDLDAISLVNDATLTITGGTQTQTINGDYTGVAGSGYRGFLVYQGNVTIQNLTITDTVARGGAGGSFFAAAAGGGGAGLGGGLLVASGGTVTVSGVNFTGDAAIGGAGGNGGATGDTGYGGGGGLGGNGGYGTNRGAGGGGGVGQGAIGGSPSAQSKPVNGGTGILPGGSGGNGFYYGGSGSGTGGANSGGGGFGGGSNGMYTAGGGGGGGGLGGSPGSTANAGSGGAGGWGGGGGGGYSHGGAGGFGGGGGSGYYGGNGGFGGGGGGGGGGGSRGGYGLGGFGGGNGGGGKGLWGAGGGGLGAGGGIFVQQGGTLIVDAGTLSGGSAVGGAGGGNYTGTSGSPGATGSGFGSGIFIQGGQTITFSPPTGQTLTIDDVITDQTGSVPATTDPGAGAILMNGAGTVDLAATNTFTGGLTLDSGTVVLGAPGAAGQYTITFGTGDPPSLSFTIADAPTNLIADFTAGDKIDVTDMITPYLSLAIPSNGTLAVPYSSDGGGTLHLNFGTAAAGELVYFNSDGGTGTDITTTPCFLAGTHILTERGEVPVEALSVGDRVVTLAGATAPIVWIGHGRVQVTRGRRCAATPILVCKNALAANVPHRDLRITKGHSLFLDGVLIPAEFLVNHRSIRWEDHAHTVSFYHIELAAHDVLIAEGAAAESYRDDGNRWLFANASTSWGEPAKPPCAPVLTGGPIVDANWRRLLRRAGPAPRPPLTNDPDLHLLADGVRIDAMNRPDGNWVFRLAAASCALRIASRAVVPAEFGLARDERPLGVALRRITARQRSAARSLTADDPRLSSGFHPFEIRNGYRWTTGDAEVPAEFMAGLDGPCFVELAVAETTTYPLLATA